MYMYYYAYTLDSFGFFWCCFFFNLRLFLFIAFKNVTTPYCSPGGRNWNKLEPISLDYASTQSLDFLAK